MFKYKKLDHLAITPTSGSSLAAGLDLHTLDSVNIPPKMRALLRTGLAFALPEKTVGLIWPRSKLANKFGLSVLGGVIDCDYRGEVMISLLNTGDDIIELRSGDKVAQMIVQEHIEYEMYETDDLGNTDRGTNGINDSEMRLR